MRCLKPIFMYDTGKLTSSGKRKLSASPPKFALDAVSIPVPCGKCKACLERRAREWVSRMRMECFSSPCSSFVTLTYRVSPLKLMKKDVQDFLKRFRNITRDFGIPLPPVRYFIVGEYGRRFHRPHWHGILFGVDLLSPAFHSSLVMFKDGHPIYSSSVLESVWRHGFVTVDRANDQNIKYVSKYILKDGSVSLKSQGVGRSLLVDVKRFSRKSTYRLRPLFYSSVHDGFIRLPDKAKGLSPVGIPSAFDSYLERCDPALFSSVKESRRRYVSSLPFDMRLSADCERIINVFQSVNSKERILDNET